MNSNVLSIVNYQTMSSREIAELCNKKHRNVCRDIQNLNETYENMGLLKIEQGYYTLASTGNQQHREFYLTKEQCIDLISGYRTDMRIRINRRWQELETNTANQENQAITQLKQALIDNNPRWQTIYKMAQINMSQRQMALVMELSDSTIHREYAKMKELGLLPKAVSGQLCLEV
ncbi:Rha family transcriptional regulator [Streptococcus pyogenes]|nr:Rha family transcriptional regulator [Moraxella osloensis]